MPHKPNTNTPDTIQDVQAREILDSRGNPTIEVDITTHQGFVARAAVPSGASTGEKEALELRDGGKRYMGKGVIQAVGNVNQIIAPALKGSAYSNQEAIDHHLLELDGTPNKEKLGANALLGVSMAVARLRAYSEGMQLFQVLGHKESCLLPTPMMNVINGGSHADNSLDIQEFMVIPAGSPTFKEALRCGAEIFHTLKKLLSEAGLNTNVGDEGGFAPNLKSNAEGFEWLARATEKAGYKLGDDVVFAVDAAASEFYQDGLYNLKGEGRQLDAHEMTSWYEDMCKKFPIASIEDGLDENDYQGWQYLTQKLGEKIQLVGDDLFVTNPEIFQEGIRQGLANSILIKLNQIGTVTETQNTLEMARENAYSAVVSHRSGETEDAFIADLAVGCGCGQIKTGSLSRSDRTSKYNQLLRIESFLGEKASFAGFSCIKPSFKGGTQN